MTKIFDTCSDDPPIDGNDSPKVFNQLLTPCISPVMTTQIPTFHPLT